MADYPHQHLQIPPKRRELKFKGNGRGKLNRRTTLSREQHAARLQGQMEGLELAFTAEHVARLIAIEPKERERQQLETRLEREKQFNRKVERNAASRFFSHELKKL